jgi:hypothetical protein
VLGFSSNICFCNNQLYLRSALLFIRLFLYKSYLTLNQCLNQKRV